MKNAVAVAMIVGGVLLAIAPRVPGVAVDVTMPGDPIWLVNGANDGDGNAGAPPAAEGVSHAIDNYTQKYLNFLDLGSGFIVTPSYGASVVTGLRLYTANDAEERDPASFEFSGSNDVGADPLAYSYAPIVSGALALPSSRNPGGSIVVDLTRFHQEVSFGNSTAYTTYKLVFPALKNAAAANSMQIGEAELLARGIPEPGTAAFLVVALVAVGFRLRRSQACRPLLPLSKALAQAEGGGQEARFPLDA